ARHYVTAPHRLTSLQNFTYQHTVGLCYDIQTFVMHNKQQPVTRQIKNPAEYRLGQYKL
ncbi:hypothetical protein AMELA_G00290360, partial [Ameiurus melas]